MMPIFSRVATAIASVILLSALTAPTVSQSRAEQARPTSIYDFTVRDIDGREVKLSRFRGKVLLIVNVASQCGLTPQYKALQEVYEKYRKRGLVVLGFPANEFGNQEPGTNAEIKEFCTTKYRVTFPMFSKIVVKGEGQAPLYRYLTSVATSPEGAGDISWNFTKFLVGRDGKVEARFSPRTPPDHPDLLATIERLLDAKR